MAQARSGPPPIPPRIDLGENEEISTTRHDIAPTDGSINSSGTTSFTPLTDTVSKDEHVAASKPLPNPVPMIPVTAKPQLHPAAKATNPSKKKEIKGRPEISIVSARPMDQFNFVISTNSKTENGTHIPHDSNSSNKPIQSVKKDALENKRPSKPVLPPPKKPPPYNSTAEGSPTTSSAPRKVVQDPARGMRTKDIKKETSSSTFYVDTNTDVNLKQNKQDQTMSSKTKNKNLSSEINVKSVDKSSLPAPRKTKRKEEQIKRPVEADSSAMRKQPEISTSKTKLKPTIIIAKKPKNTDVSGSDKVKNKTSSNTAAQVEDNSGSNSVQAPVAGDPTGRPNCPPSTVVDELNKEISQPQRPKAPPNTIPEVHPSKKNKDEGQKDSKIKDSIQKRPKVRPPRPPMAKESARIKPARAAPALPDVARKTPSAKPEGLPVSEKKSDTTPVVRPPDKGGAPHAIAKFDYTGETRDDLSFKVGDTILLTSKVDNDWLVGYLEGNVMQQGLFPMRFVDIIVNLKDENPKEKVQEPISLHSLAVAIHDFKGQADGELSFSSGQTIILIERIDDDWLKGKINDTVGIFPLNFVRIEHDLLESTANDKTVGLQDGHNNSMGEKTYESCRAIHDYQGERDDDLSFVVGNKIKITERLDNDWLKGVFSGKSGIFPASFVEMISDSEAAKTSKDVTVVTALHDYSGETPRDLSFCVGDKIKVVERINNDWLSGEFNGKEGLFPASFVECVPESLPKPSISNNKGLQKPKDTRIAKAMHDFKGERPGELSFKIGDIIQVVREIDNDWCEGMIDNKSGIFPIFFVEMEPFSRKEISRARALYDFDGGSEHDLSFKVGDVIQLLERVNEDWWTGSFGGKTGNFPATFVEIVANSS